MIVISLMRSHNYLTLINIVAYLKRWINSRGEENLSGLSLSNFSRAESASGPNKTIGRTNPGCLRLTLS